MHICIAINGEGRGHFSRARALAEILVKSHTITFRAPEHLCTELTTLFPACTVKSIPYFAFVQKGFSLDYLKTASVNASLVLSSLRIQSRIARELKAEGCKMVLSDFEPFTSRAAKLSGIPVLQLNHPGIVDRIPAFNPAALVSRAVAAYMMGHSDRRIICSFFNGDVGPIIRSELRNQEISDGKYFVVYQKKLYAEHLEPVLSRLKDQDFRLFPKAGESYEKALAGSAGLVAPAGHQSISEALALGKPVFVIPVEGQHEQELNAQKLSESGFGHWCYYQNIEQELEQYIANIDHYKRNIAEAMARGGALRRGRNRWSCADDTFRAVFLIEDFMAEIACRPEWHRNRLAAPLIAALYPV